MGNKVDKVTALILTILLGTFGVHRFLSGHMGLGVVYLLTGGVFYIGVIIDAVSIAQGTYKDANGEPWGV